MNNKDRMYSADELAGKDTGMDRNFSMEEVNQFSDLFSEFFNEYGDNYANEDEAYSEFFDAYTTTVSMDKEPEKKTVREGLSPNASKAAITTAGAGLGFLAGRALSMGDIKKRKVIISKMKSGTASSAEIAELAKLNNKIKMKTAASTVAGAGLSYGGSIAIPSYIKKQKLKDKNMSQFTNEDAFSDAFAEFYLENLSTYGDSDEGREDAYNDFVEALEGMEDEYSEEVETEGNEEETYSEEADAHAQAFMEFYADTMDIYGDSDEAVEEAYNDFMELMEAEEEDNNYSEEDFTEEELEFLEFYSDTLDIYGDTQEGLEEAYNDFVSFGEDAQEDVYSEEDVYSDEEIEDIYGDQESFIEDFADFYAHNEDVYGDDVETAFDDYADAVESIHEEDTYAEAKASAFQRVKGFGKSATSGRSGTALVGAGLGAVTGGLIGAATDKNKAERKALKAKVKAGTATDRDKARLTELSKARRNRLMKAAGVGAVTGGVAGTVGHSAIKGATDQYKANRKVIKDGKEAAAKAAEIDAKGGSDKVSAFLKKKAGLAKKTKSTDGIFKAFKGGAQKDIAGVKAAKNQYNANSKKRNYENTATQKAADLEAKGGSKKIVDHLKEVGGKAKNGQGTKRFQGVGEAFKEVTASDMNEGNDKNFSARDAKDNSEFTKSYVTKLLK